LWAADEDGNNMMSSSEYLIYSCEKYLNEVDPDQWSNVHEMFGNIAHRIRRNAGNCLEPHDNLLLARRDRETLDHDCDLLISKEYTVEKILSDLLRRYDVEGSTAIEKAKKLDLLAKECAKYSIKWGQGDRVEWDYDYGHVLLRQLATMKWMEKSGQIDFTQTRSRKTTE